MYLNNRQALLYFQTILSMLANQVIDLSSMILISFSITDTEKDQIRFEPHIYD